MIPFAAVLTIDPLSIITVILFIFSFVGFVFKYNKEVRDKVTQEDLKDFKTEHDKHHIDLKLYIDQQDRALHHRVDGIEKRNDQTLSDLQKDVKDILKILGAKK